MHNTGHRRVLITGATGFVGSALAAHCVERGDHTAVLVSDWNRNSNLIRTGLLDKAEVCIGHLDDYDRLASIIKAAGVDTVYHLAAIAQEGIALRDPWRMFEANVRGTYNLLEACRRTDGQVQRVAVASSDKAYGPVDTLPYTEDMPMNGQNPYDVSKSCTDLIARSYWHTYQLPVAVGRYANIFGPGDLNYSRLIPGSIRRMTNGEPAVIRRPVTGEFRRDFLYIDDAVNSYLAMSDGLDNGAARGHAYNFAMGVSYTPHDIVTELRHLMGTQHLKPQIADQLVGEIPQQHVAIDKAARELGWKPEWTLPEGLSASVDWYTHHLHQAA